MPQGFKHHARADLVHDAICTQTLRVLHSARSLFAFCRHVTDSVTDHSRDVPAVTLAVTSFCATTFDRFESSLGALSHLRYAICGGFLEAGLRGIEVIRFVEQPTEQRRCFACSW